MEQNNINVRELNIDKTIRPNKQSMLTDIGGSKICIIGKPGTGKSVLIKDLVFNKMHLIPVALVISGSEETNKFFKKFIPNLFIYEKFNIEIIKKLKVRQTIAKKVEHDNPWALLIMDDCMSDTKIFKNPDMIDLFKNSRHWNLTSIFSCQYVLDFSPDIRTSLDGIFIFREQTQVNREKIYKNFCSIIPTFKIFEVLMNELTQDYSCLYIDNQAISNNWQDCVFYYKAKLHANFEFGCTAYKQFANVRTKYDFL
jgi:hypothetical protein